MRRTFLSVLSLSFMLSMLAVACAADEPAKDDAKDAKPEAAAAEGAKDKPDEAKKADDTSDKAAAEKAAKQDDSKEGEKKEEDKKEADKKDDAKAEAEKKDKTPAKHEEAEGPKIFDETADGRLQIEQAVARAHEEHKSALLVFGHNWCRWCSRLHKLFEEQPDVAARLASDYVVVWIDTSQLRRYAALEKRYNDLVQQHGVPYLAVLDAEGTVVALQQTGVFEKEEAYEAEKVAQFLKSHAPDHPTAESLLVDARMRAAKSDKSVLVYCVSASSSWSRKLEEFFEAHAPELERDYILVKIDNARMPSGRKVAQRLGMLADSGLPWMAIVSAVGDVPITSNGPNGNIGYPVEPPEIDHFVAMIKKTARHSSAEEIAALETALRQAGEKIASARPQAAEGAAAPAARGE